jgi:hypothetical protein
MQLELLSRFDKNTDKFEMFLLKNIFSIPNYVKIEKPVKKQPKKRTRKEMEGSYEEVIQKSEKSDQEIQEIQQKIEQVMFMFVKQVSFPIYLR